MPSKSLPDKGHRHIAAQIDQNDCRGAYAPHFQYLTFFAYSVNNEHLFQGFDCHLTDVRHIQISRIWTTKCLSSIFISKLTFLGNSLSAPIEHWYAFKTFLIPSGIAKLQKTWLGTHSIPTIFLTLTAKLRFTLHKSQNMASHIIYFLHLCLMLLQDNQPCGIRPWPSFHDHLYQFADI